LRLMARTNCDSAYSWAAKAVLPSVWRAITALAIAMAGQLPAVDGISKTQAAENAPAGAGTVRVSQEQLRQITLAAVETYSFRMQKFAIGQIAYNEDASTLVLAPFSGRVTRLIAKIGDRVKRGDPLFELDSPDVVMPQNEFIAAAAALNKARSQLELAKIAEKRALDLYEGKAGPLKEWQQTQAQLVGAQNDLQAAETSLDAVRSRLRILGLADDEVRSLQDRGTVRRTTPIVAPIDGTVVARKVGPGQFVRSDSPDPLYTLTDLGTMWLKAFVPENEIPLIQIGQQISVRVNALPEREFKARVVHIGAVFDSATRRLVVRSEIPNPDGVLRSEMFASFTIETGGDQASPAVPIEAVIWEGEQATVWVKRDPTVFERRDVTVGIEQGGRMQIKQGVTAGEQVAARGAIFIDNESRQ
jgi:cobalt-zinc-cadmium efflux system membrane fusion protein